MDRVGLESAVRASIRAAREPGRAGIAAALAAGVAVGASVAQFFLLFGSSSLERTLQVAIPLGALALACTTGGAIRAIRAATTGKAVAWVFASNVLPPTLLCAPTIVGLVFSVPSGLVAALIVLPLVLAVRAKARDETRGRREREALFGAAMLTVVSVALLVADEVHVRGDGANAAPSAAYGCTTALTAMSALALAGWTLSRELRRAWLARRIGRGDARGLRLAVIDEAHVRVDRVIEAGEGPHRSAATSEVLGDLPRSRARALWAATAIGICLLALAAAALRAGG